MLGFAATQTQSGDREAVPLQDDSISGVAPKLSSQKAASIQVTKCNLASVQQLRRGIENNVHHGESMLVFKVADARSDPDLQSLKQS